MLLDPILRGVVLPAIVAVVVLWAGGWIGNSTRVRSGLWAPPIGVAVATMAAFAALFGPPALPPNEHWQVIFYLTALCAVAGGLAREPRVARIGQIAAGLLVVFLFAVFIVPTWDDLGDQRFLWRLLAGIAVAAVWFGVDRAGQKHGSPLLLIELILMASALSGLLMLSHNAKLAQCAGSLAAALGGALAYGLFRPQDVMARHVAGPFAALLVGLSLLGIFYDYGQVPRMSYAGLVLTTWWIVVWGGLSARWRRRWLAAGLELAGVSILLGFTVMWAWSPAEASAYTP